MRYKFITEEEVKKSPIFYWDSRIGGWRLNNDGDLLYPGSAAIILPRMFKMFENHTFKSKNKRLMHVAGKNWTIDEYMLVPYKNTKKRW